MRVDDSSFKKGVQKLNNDIPRFQKMALQQMADALLLLSQAEVPLDESTLLQSGHTFMDGDTANVAYNTIYASYQHEGVRRDGTRVVKKHRNGRKSKFLEDPLKLNLSKWQLIFAREMQKML